MARWRKPKVNTSCVADRYSGPGEKIIEISSDGGGCLISLSVLQFAGGGSELLISIYNADETIRIAGPGVPLRKPGEPRP